MPKLIQFIEAVKKLAEGVKTLSDFLSSAVSAEPDQVKKRKREKKEKDPNAPKAPLSAYLLFVRDQRQVLKDEMIELEPRATVQEIARRWRELSDEDKSVI